MKTTIKVSYSENSKAVLAETKIEVEHDGIVLNSDDVLKASNELFEKAQKYALTKSMQRI